MSNTGKEIVTAAAGVPMPMVGVSQFPRLDREKYALWAMNMEVAMEGAEFWEAVDPTAPSTRRARQSTGLIVRR